MEVKDNEILWAKTRNDAVIPTKRDEDAGYDLYPVFDNPDKAYMIPPQETRFIPTGIACAVNPNYYIQIQERGSTAKYSLKYSAGVVDSGYRDEIFIALTNCGKSPIAIVKDENAAEKILNHTPQTIVYPPNKAIAQAVVLPVPKLESKEVSYDELKQYTSERGVGKLGSSGK